MADETGFHLHRWRTREGTRGIRMFWDLYHIAKTNGRKRSHLELFEARIEAYIFSGAQHTMVGLSFDDEPPGLQLKMGVAHLFDVWLSAGSPAIVQWLYRKWKIGYPPDLDIADLRYHDRAVWWSIWHPKHSWRKGTPRWRHGNFHWWDRMAGKPVYSEETIQGPERVMVPMPERSYLADAKLERATWKRPRWPWPLEIVRCQIDMVKDEDNPGYIPVPGKGENSWDCGPDGTFGITCPAHSIEEGIGYLVGDCLRTRKRRGARPDYAVRIS